MSDSYASSSYFYSSTTNTTNGANATGHRYTTSSHTEPDGTTVVRTAHQDLGQPVVVEERRYDRTGQEQLALPEPTGTSAGGVKRITDLDDEDATGATSLDAGTAYGGPEAGGTAPQDTDENVVDRESVDLGTTPSGQRVRDPLTEGSNSRESRQYEDPSTGARLLRQSDVDVSEVI
ncbi:hypothetical protein N7474_005609 [Penicillium riverlandense]|uniref:uncharacterized protein n=1 Tax=Penicillium riverlandense TaxID=1903569 RepID=UPI00254886F3|nr:uncharacterized protein N7474_005609 [Penicillium riverlandense]KAJ5820018.1 hypothetical protein N7474_005609 [Penicillium riverlandense]